MLGGKTYLLSYYFLCAKPYFYFCTYDVMSSCSCGCV